MDYLYMYLAGCTFWCLFMSVQGLRLDIEYIISALFWPLVALHLVGGLVRLFLHKIGLI
jgi:hypothetical protein